ncbi:MAG: hypothetical protein K6G94_11050 [Kiritimatiellae bacterium]|nr:hypothetical protein [Kiritimatiellia bacterium]
MIAKEKLVRFSSLASLVLLLAAGCATPKYGEFEPKCELGQPNATAYASYGAAMAHVEGYQMAYEWQRANQKLVAEATKPEVLKTFVETPAAADALLAKIGTSYDGDPIALTQIASVTQLVMCPKCPKAPACRKVWVAALERARAASDDGYVKTFCDQQLRLCK